MNVRVAYRESVSVPYALSTMWMNQSRPPFQADLTIDVSCSNCRAAAVARLRSQLARWLHGRGVPARRQHGQRGALISTKLIVNGLVSCRLVLCSECRAAAIARVRGQPAGWLHRRGVQARWQRGQRGAVEQTRAGPAIGSPLHSGELTSSMLRRNAYS